MKENFQKGEMIIYTDISGEYQVDVIMQNEMLWLEQEQLEKLFQTERTSISKHIKNIIKSGELEEEATCAKIAQVRNEGDRKVKRQIKYYNLDMTLAIGYRVTSKIATHFRKWATSVLKDYVVKGYAVNEKLLQVKQKNIEALQSTVSLLSRSLNNKIKTLDEAQTIAKILNNFANGLNLLDNFDHKTLNTKGVTRQEAVIISEKEYLTIIDKMKSEFTSDVFANPKDNSFASSINQIYQTFDGKDFYSTLEEKAAMLLYLITKNHSFSDGNKRIAASCFLYFLDRNGLLYKNNKPIIDSGALFALTLLIAESNPSEMEIMKQIVVSVLNQEQ